ncbi:Nucleotidylyl transferase [Nemania sp. FL0031]|nr:Nucleotidylyl transferase [Nemania sp. FL0031]
MARLPSNLLALFTQALKSFESSDSTFRVLCSLPSSCSTAAGAAEEDVLPANPPRRPPKYILVLDSSFNPPTLAHRRMAISALSDPRYKTKALRDIGTENSYEIGVAETSAASRVLLLLAINNADKAPKPASFPHRLAMMYAFAQDILAVSAEQRVAENNSQSALEGEIRCEAVDIAVTTQPYFHAKAEAIAASDFYHGANRLGQPEGSGSAGNAVNSEQVYLAGYDTLIRIFNPKYYPNNSMKASLDPFFAHTRLRITMRTDDDWGSAAEQISYLDELRNGKLEEAGGKVEWADRVELVQGRQEDEAIISSTKVRDAVRRQDWEALRVLVGEDVVFWIRENNLYINEDR